MGFLDGLLGNASEINAAEIEAEFGQLWAGGEHVDRAYQILRDLLIFTNKRLVLVNRQGITGSKTEYLSIPYGTITFFSVETAGHFDRDAELKIWIRGRMEPVQQRFTKQLNIYEVQSLLAGYVLQ